MIMDKRHCYVTESKPRVRPGAVQKIQTNAFLFLYKKTKKIIQTKTGLSAVPSQHKERENSFV